MKEDNSPLLLPKQTKYVQQIVGSLLYYVRAVDSTILPALNQISRQQANPTQQTLAKCHQLLDYYNTYKNTSVCFHASDMILEVDSDAAYLVMPQAKSRFAGYF